MIGVPALQTGESDSGNDNESNEMKCLDRFFLIKEIKLKCLV